MPVVSQLIDYTGKPVVTLYVTMGETDAEDRRGRGFIVPGPLKVLALVDTGAGRSQVDLTILEQLGLRPNGEEDVFTASTGKNSESRDIYVVNLAFAGDRPGALANDLPVIGTDSLAGLKVEMLLGRDVLDCCLLAYDGPNRRFSLAYDAPPG